MSSYNLPIENVAQRLAATFDEQLETALVAELTARADGTIRKIAKEMCSNLKTNIVGYKNCADPFGGLTIMMVIDGVSEKI